MTLTRDNGILSCHSFIVTMGSCHVTVLSRSFHVTVLSDDHQTSNDQHHVCSHCTEGDYYHTGGSSESCPSRHDETHSEGEDSDGGEYV